MISRRGLTAIVPSVFLSLPATLANPAPEPALGVLTRAYEVHLNSMSAYVGLSVFEGESISTEAEGRIGVRVGSVMLAFSGSSNLTLHRSAGGAHVDMGSGWLYFSSPANSTLEVHPTKRYCVRQKTSLRRLRFTFLRNR